MFDDGGFNPNGELASMDLSEQRAAWDALAGPDAFAVVGAVLAAPHRFAPPVLHRVAAVMVRSGRVEDAAFWFYAAQLRTRYDVLRCRDETALGIADELTQTYGPPIQEWAAQHPGLRRDALRRVLEWDRVTPHDYEHRWINLHGLGVGYYRPGEPFSAHPDFWPRFAEQARAEFVKAVEPDEQVGNTVFVTPTGEHAEIDVSGQAETITALHGSDTATVEAVLAAPQRHTPPVLYALAAALFAGGRREEGATWYYSAQLRARFDVERCADPTVEDAVAILRERYGEPINRWAFTEARGQLRTIVERAVAWDRAAPHAYDHRWINLHGMGAFGVDPGAPLSRPEAEWPAIAEQVRTDYLTGLNEVLADLD